MAKAGTRAQNRYPATRLTYYPGTRVAGNTRFIITGSAVALHYCKAHSKINRKMESSTPCKIVTPENVTLKLGTRDCVEEITYCTNFDADRLSGGFSSNR